ncbi:MAG TPA: NAD-dependent succinate-semialdehyde dehydrogenase [Candidatus Binatia bacterium]|nr:NAD-dependent succinate-semialdehyde dehydrogenase [Candidatus Binatia bacterium]
MKTFSLYLDGNWVETRDTVKVVNPATGGAFAAMSAVGRAEVAKAIERAHEAFLAWRKQTGKARGEFLQKIANELERRKDEVARTITMENGKPLPQSMAELNLSIDHLRWFAEEARRTYGRVVPNQVEGKRHLVIKCPMGVVGAISPWNFPLVLSVRKVAPALAAGCTIILKPASATPLCCVAFAECVHAAQLPANAFQLVAGKASEIAQEFLDNPLCRKITFTGSTEVGKTLIRGAADGVKPLSLELGGQAPVLVFDDADLDRAIEGVLIAKFRNTGQSCIAANRIYVQRGIYDRFVDALAQRTKALKFGEGIGPLINQEAVDHAITHVKDAVAAGAKLLTGGSRAKINKGFFFEPTVLADVPDTALCMREETFAPIAVVTRFETELEAVRRANSLPYGLSAYVFTRDLSRAFRLMEDLDAGMMGINDGVPTTSQCPFGGMKQSGWGRELGIEGMDAFLETKHISLRIGS